MASSINDGVLLRIVNISLESVTTTLVTAEIMFLCKEPVIDLPDASYLIVGDIHGDIDSLLRSFVLWEQSYDHILFLGDIVDRGKNSLGCLTLLLSMIVEDPEKVHLIRGNHETLSVAGMYGFKSDCVHKANIDVFRRSCELFARIPLGAVIADRLFAVHGGIASDGRGKPVLLRGLRDLPMEIEPRHVAMQLLWNDPTNKKGVEFAPSFRGEGTYLFGRPPVEEFLENADLETVVRAHQVFKEGYRTFFDEKMWSVFSCEDYYEGVKPHALGWKDGVLTPEDLRSSKIDVEKDGKRFLDQFR